MIPKEHMEEALAEAYGVNEDRREKLDKTLKIIYQMVEDFVWDIQVNEAGRPVPSPERIAEWVRSAREDYKIIVAAEETGKLIEETLAKLKRETPALEYLAHAAEDSDSER